MRLVQTANRKQEVENRLSAIRKRRKTYGSCKLARKRILSPWTVRKVVREAVSNTRKIVSWGYQVLKKHTMAPHTSKLLGMVARRQPLLSTINKTKHLKLVKPHWNYDWKRLLWLDEAKIERFVQAHHQHVWQQNGMHTRNLIPTVKYSGGSLMF